MRKAPEKVHRQPPESPHREPVKYADAPDVTNPVAAWPKRRAAKKGKR